jgi:hypothetical protein
MRSRGKDSVLDMRGSGKLETIQEAKDEKGSTMTTVLRGHASDSPFKNTMGLPISTSPKLRDTIKSEFSEVFEAP